MEFQDNIRDNKMKETETAHTSEDGRKEGATERYGKFKSPDALYSAYVNLEADYTRKSQSLKKLKEFCLGRGIDPENLSDAEPEQTENFAEGGQDVREKAENDTSDNIIDDETRESIIKEYLEGIVKRKIPLIKGGGTGVTAEKSSPKTIKEAGKLALRYLRDNNR